jgi:hypothetical protein
MQLYHLLCMSVILNAFLFSAPCIELHNALCLSHVSHHPWVGILANMLPHSPYTSYYLSIYVPCHIQPCPGLIHDYLSCIPSCNKFLSFILWLLPHNQINMTFYYVDVCIQKLKRFELTQAYSLYHIRWYAFK